MLAVRIKYHNTGHIKAVLKNTQVNIQSEMFRSCLFDKIHIICHKLICKNCRQMDLRTHHHVILLRFRKHRPNDFSPVFHRRQLVIDDAHLRPEDTEAQRVGDPEIIHQFSAGFFHAHHPILIQAVINPVAIFHRLNLILPAERVPFGQIVIAQIRIAVDMGIGQYFHTGGTHVIHILKTVLQVHGSSVFSRITVNRDAPFYFSLCIHMPHTPLFLFSALIS